MILYNHRERKKQQAPQDGAKEQKMKNEFLGLRISSETKRRLMQLAEADGRTLSNYVRMILEKLALEKEAKKEEDV